MFGSLVLVLGCGFWSHRLGLRGYWTIWSALALAQLVGAVALTLLKLWGLSSGAWQLTPWLLGLVAPPRFYQRHSPSVQLLCLSLAAFWWTWNQNFPSQDYWLDGPVQSMLQRGVFPPPHPFQPHKSLAGPYGHDLWIAYLSETLHLNCQVTFQYWRSVAVALVPLAVSFSFNQRGLGLGLTALIGVGVGGWMGMLDHSFHYYASQSLLLWTVVSLRPTGWFTDGLLVAGLLAISPLAALVALLWCAPAPPWARQPTRWWVGWMAMVALLLPSYALDCEHAQTWSRVLDIHWQWPPQQCWEPYPYWRISHTLQTFCDCWPAATEHEVSSFLSCNTLWLYGLVLPLAILLVRPCRPAAVAAALIVFPSLVHFGSIYQHDTYRFHWMAGSILALLVAHSSRGAAMMLVTAGLVHLGFPQPQTQVLWDRALLASLRPKIRAGQPILTNLSRADEEHPYWLWTESLALSELGCPAAGHQDGYPPWQISPQAQLFWEDPDLSRLLQLDVQAVVLDPRALDSLALQRIRQLGLPGERGQLWEYFLVPIPQRIRVSGNSGDRPRCPD